MKDLDSIYFTARELPSEDRPAYLSQACEGDQVLRMRVEQMLAVADDAEALMADLRDEEPEERQPARRPVKTIKLELADAPDEAVGQKIGRYKILERVGEGGCGVVYVAEQTVPVRRRVALKVIKLGMDTKQVVARFEAERQALAMMDHPHIAKVLDGGSTESGRPYFVMELVRGIKITDYCDQANLPTKERLKLFIHVCQAIQHAHQKGIIHRDIKPSNILVTLNDGVPVPKVIDFGIAKATEGRLTEATVYTQLHQFIGTPAYMSPEQAEMSSLDIDTRSDIYSLGVLLYELLAGSTPFDSQELMSQGIEAMRRTIREQEPARPSLRLATLQSDELTTAAKRRAVEAPKLIRQLSGDLDWIVMKCLEKDRSRRYETANGLAADLKRHLNNDTVVARPPSSAYRFQKLVRRNKLTFAAGTAIAAVLLLGIIASTWQAVRATRAKQEALAAQAQALAAKANETKQRELADTARASETKLRQQAQVAELAARQRAYASDMNVAKQALDENNLGRALELVNRQKPQPGQRDLRGWEWRYLWQQTRSDALFTLCQINGEVSSVAASSDGNWLAVGGYHHGGTTMWDLRTRQAVARLATNEEQVRAAFSPTEQLLAYTSASPSSGDSHPSLHLWSTATRQMVNEIPLEDDDCLGLAFSKDGRTLLTYTVRGDIVTWRVSDGTKLASYPTTDLKSVPATTPFAVTSDPGLAAYAYGLPQRIRIIDLRDGKELWTAPASKFFITALAFSLDGKILASAAGFDESDIRLWDVATGKEIGRLEGHGSWVSSLLFWPDGKKLASSSADQTIRIWDLAGRKCLDVLRGHRLDVWRLALLPDGRTLVSGCKDGTVCFWDTSVTHTHQARITIPDHVIAWRFAPDSQSLLTLDGQGDVTRWTGTEFQQREPLLNITTNITSTITYDVFSRDGRFLATGSTNGVIQVWDVSRRVLWRQLTNEPVRVITLTFLAGGNRLLTWSDNGSLLHEWDLTTGREDLQPRRPVPELVNVVPFPDDERYVEYGYNGAFRFNKPANDVVTKTNLEFLEGSEAAVSPDGKLFAIAGNLGYARVWETTTWRDAATLSGYLAGVSSVAFSPDARRLATGSDKQEALRLWDIESWQDVLTLEGQGAAFSRTAFSTNGNALGSLNATGTLHLWCAPSWAEIDAAEAKEKAETRQP